MHRCPTKHYHALDYQHAATNSSSLINWLPVLSNIELLAPRRMSSTDKFIQKVVGHQEVGLHEDLLNPPAPRLTSLWPIWRNGEAQDLDDQWRKDWELASETVLVDDPTSEQPGFDLPRRE